MEKTYHPYHLVNNSPWPITLATSVLCLVFSLIAWFHYGKSWGLIGATIFFMIAFMMWMHDVNYESEIEGNHNSVVMKGMKLGFILFMVSEMFFFLSFFWAFFHSSLSPAMEMGMQWPPQGIEPLDPFSIPIFNTALLLSSGLTVTWAHFCFISGNSKQAVLGLFFTVTLGMTFTMLQGMEYFQASFSIADSVYGSTFFVATGFHGIHVIIGTMFLVFCFCKAVKKSYSKHYHVSFELASWYWHFVDVIWMFLFICMYWWGGA